MFRLYDWECFACQGVAEHVLEIAQGEPVPRTMQTRCPHCDQWTEHTRLVSKPAQYMGEKVYNPQVYGGKFDTMGHKSAPTLPPPLPSDAKWGDWKDRWHSKEYKETKAEILAVRKENKTKRARAEAIKRGENINMRTLKLPGDPKMN